MDYWHCPNHHIIGYSETRESGRAYLYVFRHAFPVAPLAINGQIATKTSGDTVAYCSICGLPTKWHRQKQMIPVSAGIILTKALA